MIRIIVFHDEQRDIPNLDTNSFEEFGRGGCAAICSEIGPSWWSCCRHWFEVHTSQRAWLSGKPRIGGSCSSFCPGCCCSVHLAQGSSPSVSWSRGLPSSREASGSSCCLPVRLVQRTHDEHSFAVTGQPSILQTQGWTRVLFGSVVWIVFGTPSAQGWRSGARKRPHPLSFEILRGGHHCHAIHCPLICYNSSRRSNSLLSKTVCAIAAGPSGMTAPTSVGVCAGFRISCGVVPRGETKFSQIHVCLHTNTV